MNKDLIIETKEKLTDIADMLYKGDVREGIAGISFVISSLSEIVDYIEDEEIKTRLLNDALVPALEAMENEDGTMLADVVNYELIEILDLLMEQ